jgi:hypothetical protein
LKIRRMLCCSRQGLLQGDPGRAGAGSHYSPARELFKKLEIPSDFCYIEALTGSPWTRGQRKALWTLAGFPFFSFTYLE